MSLKPSNNRPAPVPVPVRTQTPPSTQTAAQKPADPTKPTVAQQQIATASVLAAPTAFDASGAKKPATAEQAKSGTTKKADKGSFFRKPEGTRTQGKSTGGAAKTTDSDSIRSSGGFGAPATNGTTTATVSATPEPTVKPTPTPEPAGTAVPTNTTATGSIAGADPAKATEALQQLDAAKAVVDSTKAEVGRLDAKMAADLSKLGPGLTQAQQQAYIQGFREQNKDVYDRYTQATSQMSDILAQNKTHLADAALRDPAAAQKVYDSMKIVGASGGAQSALELSNTILSDPRAKNSALFGPGNAANVQTEILQPALTQTASSLLMKNGGNPEAAFNELKQVTGNMTGVQQTLFPGADGKAQWDGLMNQMQDVAQGKPGALQALTDSGLMKGAGGEAIVGMGLTLGMSLAAEGPKANEVAGVIEQLANRGKQGINVLGKVTKALNESGKMAALGKFGDAATSLSNLGSRLAPGLGLLANGASLVGRLQQAGSEGMNAGDALGILGDALGVAGSLPIPGAQVVGLVGTAISMGGDALSGLINDNDNRNRQNQLLGQILDPAIAQQLVNGDQNTLRSLSQDLGQTPQQIQSLLGQYPNLMTPGNTALDPVRDAKKHFKMSSDQVFGLLSSVGRNTPDPSLALRGFLDAAAWSVPTNGNPDPKVMEVAVNAFQQKAQDTSMPAAWNEGINNGISYLKSMMRQDERYRWDPRWR